MSQQWVVPIFTTREEKFQVLSTLPGRNYKARIHTWGPDSQSWHHRAEPPSSADQFHTQWPALKPPLLVLCKDTRARTNLNRTRGALSERKHLGEITNSNLPASSYACTRNLRTRFGLMGKYSDLKIQNAAVFCLPQVFCLFRMWLEYSHCAAIARIWQVFCCEEKQPFCSP